MNTFKLEKALAEAGFEQYLSVLAPLLKAGIGIVTTPADETTIPVGASKFGGSPDLPPHKKWPELYDRSLDFIAQINLQDVTAFDADHQLPSSGIIYFFYNESRLWEVENIWARNKGIVLFFNGEISILERRKAPEQQHYTAATLSFEQDANLPQYSELLENGIIEHLFEQKLEAYLEMEDSINAVSYKYSKANRMLGYPNHVQGNPLSEAASIASNETTFQKLPLLNPGWTLLLQVDSDSNANMFWGDYGCLYFCISNEDLAQRRFDKAIVVSQST